MTGIFFGDRDRKKPSRARKPDSLGYLKRIRITRFPTSPVGFELGQSRFLGGYPGNRIL